MDGFRKREEWLKRGADFLVMIRRHTERRMWGAVDEDENIWCVYAYIYPRHPLFQKIDPSGPAYQDSLSGLPLHGGPTFFSVHTEYVTNKIVSFQVGCDYNHIYDDAYTRMTNEHEAFGLFSDAQDLYDTLQAIAEQGDVK